MKRNEKILTSSVPRGAGFYTKPEIAAIMRVSVRTVTIMMRRGEISYLKFNQRLIRFRLDDINRRLTETVLMCEFGPGPSRAGQEGEGGKRKGGATRECGI